MAKPRNRPLKSASLLIRGRIVLKKDVRRFISQTFPNLLQLRVTDQKRRGNCKRAALQPQPELARAAKGEALIENNTLISGPLGRDGSEGKFAEADIEVGAGALRTVIVARQPSLDEIGLAGAGMRAEGVAITAQPSAPPESFAPIAGTISDLGTDTNIQGRYQLI